MDNEPISESARAESSDLNASLNRSVKELEERVDTTRDRIHEINERAVHFIQERPAAAIGIAFGVGYFVGKMASKRWFI
jgi:ElaB/YqjD/DUF883 family membrane-anchored ribosome-binding protein